MSIDPPQDPGLRSSLGRRFFVQVAAVSVGLVLLSGAVDGWFNYREARTQLAALQALQAQAAAAEIEQYLATVRRGLEAVQALPWGRVGFGPAERQQELQRLLPLNPAVVEVRDLDASGRELLAVSRTEPDRLQVPGVAPASAAPVGPAASASTPGPGFAPPQFNPSGEPVVQWSVARTGPGGGATIATLNLRFLADVVSGLRVAEGGEVYVVDTGNRLIAHPDPAQVLRQRQLGQAGDAVARARAALGAGATRLDATEVQGLQGATAIATALLLRDTGWLLVVEQPSARALQPVWATLQRTALLLAVAAVAALLVSAAFARRMAAPVARLRATTAAIAQGRRGERIELRTGDELQGLAGDFNTMMERLETSYAQLEAKVADRTAEAVQGRQDAEQARQAMTRFLAMASHDLRQPMHAIGLMVSVLRTGALTADRPAMQDRIDRVYRAVRGMDSMFNGLLDVTKLDAGAVKPQPQPVTVASLFDRLAALHSPLAQGKGLDFRVRPSALVVDSDPEEVHRMLSNLCTNAIRYTARGGVLLAARRRGSQVWIRVFDTGSGIAPEEQERIFDEFVRLGPGRGAGSDEGLGLGLSIVRRTAALLGASVAVRSRPGRGSCFTLALPVSSAVMTPVGETTVEGGDLSRAFTIVVDDDALNRGAMADLLRSWGSTVVTAADAEQALAECSRHLRTPDVIVTDLRLGPGPDGLSLIRQLRAQAEWPIPALLVTAEPRLPREPDGDVRVLQKPVADTVLRAALQQALAGGHLS